MEIKVICTTSFFFLLSLSGFSFSWCCHTCHYKTFLYEISSKWLASTFMLPGLQVSNAMWLHNKNQAFSINYTILNYRVPKQTNFLQHSKWAASVCEFTVPSHGWSTLLVSSAPVPVTWEENLLWNMIQYPRSPTTWHLTL